MKVRCASVLKPLYGWVAGPWARPAVEPSIVLSDNHSTDEVIHKIGGLPAALEGIAHLTGVRWEVAPTWGQVLVNDVSLKVTYHRLADAKSKWAKEIRELMTDVVPSQRFGVPEGIPMKAGWDLDEGSEQLLTHVVAIDGNRTRVAVTSVHVTTDQREEWFDTLAVSGPEGVIHIHEELAGDQIRELLGF
jgi:hypothetical protein